MKLSQLKKTLDTATSVSFQLPDGTFVPEHFHVTEVGLVTKHFIDCGGTVRQETVANLQLWSAGDTDHRLKPERFQNILSLSEKTLNLGDHEIEVEYQVETIGKYGLAYRDGSFVLTNKRTDCLAKENCGVPTEKQKTRLSDLSKSTSEACCTPGGGCC